MSRSFKLTVHDADTGKPVWEIFSFPSLKEALAKFRAMDREGEIEYGLVDIELKSDIIKGKKILKPVEPSKKPYSDIR